MSDFKIGPLNVSPSRRVIEKGDDSLAVEPRVMQVLVLLAREPGKVVSRQVLFDEVWGGVPVGDDSINRAVAGVRKALELDPEGLKLETIPRTGYRLQVVEKSSGEEDGSLSRRTVMGALFVSALGLGAGGLWITNSRRSDRFQELMRQGEDAVAYGDPTAEPAKFFQSAVEIRPENARAQGLLAYSIVLGGGFATKGADPHQAADAITAAHEIDPNEPHAHLAQLILQRSTLDFAATEDRLVRILEDFPDNIPATRLLWNVRHCVGRSRDALALVERAIKLQPLGAYNHFPRAQLLWILGRDAEADRVIDNTLQFWPNHQFVRFARFIIFAFTGRSRAALAMINNPRTVPQLYSQDELALWRASLPALDQPSAENIALARKANLDAAKANLELSSQAVLVLSALGEVDAAFEIANALFVVPGGSDAVPAPARSTAWRFAPWLFTPPTLALRNDPRFRPLCDVVGLTDYWSTRGIEPDYKAGLS